MNPAAALGGAARIGEIRNRLLFLIGALIVYRIGTFIPVPGIDPQRVAAFFDDQSTTILGVANMFSGGALERLSIFALGVMPYISASIIIQMMTHVVPSLSEMRKEGESGRRKITQLTRYGTVVLGVAWGLTTAVSMQSQGTVLTPGFFTWVFPATVTLTCGTMFLMWLGEQITERGVGNGISMLIVVSIITGLPSAFSSTIDQINTGQMGGPVAIGILAIVVGVTAFCVYMERAQRRITVNYAKRQVGRRMMGGQTTHLPFKLNMAGVIPPIFATSLLLFPATIASFAGTSTDSAIGGWLQRVAASLSYGQPLHMVLYAALIIGFAFFYTALVFNARDTAENLKKSGAFIPGIRPGQQTGEYIDKVLTRLTMWGALYMTGVCLVPEFLMASQGVPFQFGGTSLLIVVVVVMDFVSQLHAHATSHQYPDLMKKANLLGGRNNGGG
jgi:preprotein translocase subunit SecY